MVVVVVVAVVWWYACVRVLSYALPHVRTVIAPAVRKYFSGSLQLAAASLCRLQASAGTEFLETDLSEHVRHLAARRWLYYNATELLRFVGAALAKRHYRDSVNASVAADFAA